MRHAQRSTRLVCDDGTTTALEFGNLVLPNINTCNHTILQCLVLYCSLDKNGPEFLEYTHADDMSQPCLPHPHFHEHLQRLHRPLEEGEHGRGGVGMKRNQEMQASSGSATHLPEAV